MANSGRRSCLLFVGLAAVGCFCFCPMGAAEARIDWSRAHVVQAVTDGGAHVDATSGEHAAETEQHHEIVPSLFWSLPFVLLLLCIAILPLIQATEHWWHKNESKLLVALALGALTLLYYALRGYGFSHGHEPSAPGLATSWAVLLTALHEYVPFIVLLFSLFVISGGIRVTGDLPAHPATNAAFLAIGAFLASFIGTTGASMLLIRPLLQTNRERKYVVHTVVFFIFLVSNVGGCLLPIGDPPLFLGYLKQVPFLWTLWNLWVDWLVMVLFLLVVYYIMDHILYRREGAPEITADESQIEPVRVTGLVNIPLLVAVVFCVGTLDPGKPFLGTGWHPFPLLREGLQILLAGLSLYLTDKTIRRANEFNYYPIAEVACLFIGIFITMQVPIEILRATGDRLGLTTPEQFFWATGLLSSFLDNAPTYVVFFETAGSLHVTGHTMLTGVATATGEISNKLLIAISLGSVFMGANSYIGNGPNFMVKSIAEQSGVKMPSFFGYILFYTLPILIPSFIIFTIFMF